MTSPSELGFRIKILTDKEFEAGQTMHVGCYRVGLKINSGEGQQQTATVPGPVNPLGYFPNARRSASLGGSPASRIFFWAAAMSYSNRRNSMKPSSAS